jgi:spore coat protein U-like protein
MMNHFTKLTRILLLASASLLVGGISTSNDTQAGTLTANTTASATIGKTCTISMGTVAFGNLPPGTANVTTSGTLSMMCNKNVAYNAVLTYSAADYAASQAQMRGAKSGDTINYDLVNPQTGGLMGGVNGTNDYIRGTGNGLVQTYTIGAKIIGNVPYVTPDTYSDTATFTMSF